MEAHKVILAGSSPQTTIRSPHPLVSAERFCLLSKLKTEREVFWSPPQRNLLNNLMFRRLGLNQKETQESKIKQSRSPSPGYLKHKEMAQRNMKTNF